MNIGILGAGRMGVALGAALARAGHDVVFGAREAGRPLAVARARTVSYAAAAAHAEVLVVALRWTAAREIVSALPLSEKVLISCTNPETDDVPLAIGFDTSAAEEIAAWSRAPVAEAFNYLYAERLDDAPGRARSDATVAYCGDARAGAVAKRLIADLGFDPLDAGPLHNARYLEPLAQLVVYLVREKKLGPTGLTLTFSR